MTKYSDFWHKPNFSAKSLNFLYNCTLTQKYSLQKCVCTNKAKKSLPSFNSFLLIAHKTLLLSCFLSSDSVTTNSYIWSLLQCATNYFPGACPKIKVNEPLSHFHFYAFFYKHHYHYSSFHQRLQSRSSVDDATTIIITQQPRKWNARNRTTAAFCCCCRFIISVSKIKSLATTTTLWIWYKSK